MCHVKVMCALQPIKSQCEVHIEHQRSYHKSSVKSFLHPLLLHLYLISQLSVFHSNEDILSSSCNPLSPSAAPQPAGLNTVLQVRRLSFTLRINTAIT